MGVDGEKGFWRLLQHDMVPGPFLLYPGITVGMHLFVYNNVHSICVVGL